MNPFKSYSQANQDRFVHALIGDTGTFLDIGASHPTELSNTFGLEQVGWTGVCVEIEPTLCEMLRKQRKATVVQVNALNADWLEICKDHMLTDYCSLDIDEGTLGVCRNLISQMPRFNVITLEHDKYRFGPEPQRKMREIMKDAGYILIAHDVANVATPDMPFEDWFCHPPLADKAREILKDLWPSPKN